MGGRYPGLHRQKRVHGIGRLILEHVESRSCYAPFPQGLDQRSLVD
jgi:hypothetical protein